MRQKGLTYQLLTELMEALEKAQGHPFGVGKHLQVQTLLERLPDEPTDAFLEQKLPLLLGPLFVKDEQGQKDFKDLYRQCLERALAVHAKEEPVLETTEGKKAKKWARIVKWLSVPVLALAGYFFYLWLQPPASQRVRVSETMPMENGEILIDTLWPDSAGMARLAGWESAFFCGTDKQKDTTELARYALLSDLGVQVVADSSANGEDSVCVSVFMPDGNSIPVHFLPHFTQPKEQEYITVTEDKSKEFLFEEKDLPYPRSEADLDKLKPPEVHPAMRFFVEYEWPLKIAFLLALTALLWAILRWREYQRKKLIAEHDNQEKPPYVWNIRIDGLEDPEVNETFHATLNRLRQRTADEHHFLDMPATIGATIERGGFVDFRFAQHTRPPEYLLLIDRQASANHRAHLFDGLYQAFKKNEVLVERFFFDGDIRLCHNEGFPNGISLQALLHKYHKSRLLVVGNGYQLLSPLSGKLSKWTDIFTQWKQRSLLSTVPTNAWGRREQGLQGLFHMLPASLQGLNLLIEQLDAGEDADWKKAVKKVNDAPEKHIELDGGLLHTLRQNFSEDLLNWIAACAVYPTLHYDLTLYLGQLLSTEEKRLVTVRNMAELTRLPWFVEGQIPPEARMLLLDYLKKEQPRTLLTVRKGLHQLMLANHPPEGSAAYDDYRMNMAMNEWLFTQDALRKKELEKEIADLIEQGVEPDFTVVKELEGEPSPLAFPLPDDWKKAMRKQLYRNGFRSLGLRAWLKDLRWALPILAAAIGLACWLSPEIEQCKKTVEYRGKTLCIDSEEDHFLYLEFLARDTIEQGDIEALDNIVSSIKKEYMVVDGLDTLPISWKLSTPVLDSAFQVFRQNVSTALYNQGVPHSQNAERYNPEKEPQLFQLHKDSTCIYFNKAIVFDTSAIYVRRVYAWCNELPEPKINIPDEASGLVTDSDGNPLSGVQVSGGGFNVNTLGNGRFILPLAERGYREPEIRLSFRKDGYGTRGKTFSLEGQPNLSVTVLSKNIETVPVYGIVLDKETRQPIVGANIYSEFGDTISDARGRFQMTFTVVEDFFEYQKVQVEKEGYEQIMQTVTTGEYVDTFFLKADEPVGIGIDTIGGLEVAPDTLSTKIPIPVMVKVPGGSFTMGCTPEQRNDCTDDEKPTRTVEVAAFEIGKYEVTVGEYLAFADATNGNYPEWLEPGNNYHVETGSNDYYKRKGNSRDAVNLPVVGVSWYDAVAYAEWLSGQTEETWRLPTEAEWEYAARGGKNGQETKYSGSDDLSEVGWFNSNSDSRPHEVGTKGANELGIHDMSGNVWEWCQDVWHGNYNDAPKDARAWNTGGDQDRRVLRGGSWLSVDDLCRVSSRNWYDPDDRNDYVGFRLTRVP